MAPEHRMEPSVFYNDNEPFIALWLAELAKGGHLPEGDLEIRSIKEIAPAVLRSYTHCHFFAGIGGWPLALAMAGWPRARPVWTMSCPCQPFSAAGKRLGTADERHLWPDALRLIAECRPPTIFGEQVASKDGRLWLAGVRADLEVLGYAFGAADLCAAGVGAPHERQRIYWVANANGGQQSDRDVQRSGEQRQQQADGENLKGLGDATCESLCRRGQPWEPSIAIECEDGFRRLGPGALAVAHGIPNRMGRLRGYGNAIVPQVAAEFVAAYLDT